MIKGKNHENWMKNVRMSNKKRHNLRPASVKVSINACYT